jgi:hypothetical protein
MGEICSTCFKVNKDEALSEALAMARNKALEEQRSVAIVIEDDQYKLYDAFYAYGNNMIVKQTVSYL